MSYISIQTEVEVEIDTDDIIAQMNDREKATLLKELDLEAIRAIAQSKITPRQVVYALRKFDVDLRGVRDQILEHFPITPKASDES